MWLKIEDRLFNLNTIEYINKLNNEIDVSFPSSINDNTMCIFRGTEKECKQAYEEIIAAIQSDMKYFDLHNTMF